MVLFELSTSCVEGAKQKKNPHKRSLQAHKQEINSLSCDHVTRPLQKIETEFFCMQLHYYNVLQYEKNYSES